MFSQEKYDHESMLRNRKSAIDIAAKAGTFGLILGSLGRQGSTKVLQVRSPASKIIFKLFLNLVTKCIEE